MTGEDELEYSTRRNRQETLSAQKALEPAARYAHSRLADLHRKNVREALSRAVRTSDRGGQDDTAA
jgi:hypothetical protein